MNARPKLPIYPNGDTTVAQTWIPGQHPAIEDEMLTCDDRKEQNKIGDVLREGSLRPAKPSPTRRYRTTSSAVTAHGRLTTRGAEGEMRR